MLCQQYTMASTFLFPSSLQKIRHTISQLAIHLWRLDESASKVYDKRQQDGEPLQSYLDILGGNQTTNYRWHGENGRMDLKCYIHWRIRLLYSTAWYINPSSKVESLVSLYPNLRKTAISLTTALERYQSDSSDASSLGKPLKFEFSGRIAKNRFLKAAMTGGLCTWDAQDFKKRGFPTENLINVYKRWGEGGFCQILTGNLMIEYDQSEAIGNPIIPRVAEFTGPRFKAFKKLATKAKAHGSLIVGQVSHPGRQCEVRIQRNPMSASDVQLKGMCRHPPVAGPLVNSQMQRDGHGIRQTARSNPRGIK